MQNNPAILTGKSFKKAGLLALALMLLLSLFGCSTPMSSQPFAIEDITMEQLEKKMDDKETFTLLVERDECNFCNAMNAYMDETKDEHPGIHLYKLNTTAFELYRENEGDMTLISSTEEGQAFLARFPYFLYTPAIYKIKDGKPVDAGIGYDESRHTVSNWNVDSTIDWNAAKPVDLWSFLSEPAKAAPAAASSASSAK